MATREEMANSLNPPKPVFQVSTIAIDATGDGNEENELMVGIIGGTGLEDPNVLKDAEVREVRTPYGLPSGPFRIGRINGIKVALLSRHGPKHELSPSNVPYRANIWAFKDLGVKAIIATNACGSLKAEVEPGMPVFIDQFIDLTRKRETTFFDGSNPEFPGVLHVSMGEPFCRRLRSFFEEESKALGYKHKVGGTLVCIEGPRFSSRAESRLYKSWGADLIGMTTVPEVCLAAELGIPYAAMGLVTDYDAWHESEDAVSHAAVVESFAAHKDKAPPLIAGVIKRLAEHPNWDLYIQQKSSALLTAKA